MKAGILSDLFRVGVEKPLAYLPLRTVRDICGFEPAFMQGVLERDWHLNTALYSEAECHIASGALYVWHESSLKHLLDQNTATLTEAGWPQEPWEFVNCISSHIAPAGTKLFDLIADAYGDKTNPGRTDAPAP